MKVDNRKLVGSKINGLIIAGYKCESSSPGVKKRQYFDCICHCGKQFITRTDAIKAGMTKSCGCLTSDLISNKRRLPNEEGPIKLIYRYYKYNAKRRNLEFNLDHQEFEKLIFGDCVYCGDKPSLTILNKKKDNQEKNKGRREREIICNGIDRIDSNVGYNVENCVSCCSICNIAKSDLSPEEFENWIQRLINFRKEHAVE